MNICAVIYGSSLEHERTMLSLKSFNTLSIMHLSELETFNLNHSKSDYAFFIKSGDIFSACAAQYLEPNLTWQAADIIYSDEAIIYGKNEKS